METFNHPIDDRRQPERLGVPAILVVGDTDAAAEAVLQLCNEGDVTLSSHRAGLQCMSQAHRFTVNELFFENEIRLWLRTSIERIRRMEDGRSLVFFAAGGPPSAVFDEVLDCSEASPPTADAHPGQRDHLLATLSDWKPRRAG